MAPNFISVRHRIIGDEHDDIAIGLSHIVSFYPDKMDKNYTVIVTTERAIWAKITFHELVVSINQITGEE